MTLATSAAVDAASGKQPQLVIDNVFKQFGEGAGSVVAKSSKNEKSTSFFSPSLFPPLASVGPCPAAAWGSSAS